VSRAHLAAAAACVVFAAGCGGGDGAGNSSEADLIGAGSTFVYPLVAKWIPSYSKTHGGTITYGPIGSGGGIRQLTNRTIDFGASDAPMTRDQADACKGCLQLPWALAGTSIPYNVPGAPKHLKLTASLLADIFLGKVRWWNDTEIAKLNPAAALPPLRITPIFRRDSSGTTYNLTDYLARVSAEWKRQVGTGPSVRFPAGTGANGSSGVAAALASAKGGITYIDAAYSIENGFAYAALGNRAGSFELPDRKAVAAAAAAVTSVPKDNAVSLVDPPASAADAYPLSTFTYAVVPERPGKAAVLKSFLDYAIGPGQRFAPALQFAELPPVILEADRRTIDRIKQR
jgi:phosphate transport system substrate-binding protein